MMPEDKNCKLLQSSKKADKKKKKRKKAAASAIPPGNTEKLPAVSLLPETLPVPLPQTLGQPRGLLPKLKATSKKDRKGLSSSGRRVKEHSKDSPSLLTATNKTSASGVPAQGYVAELSAQASESLRWQGVLEDPQAEERRLELYRANRRQRYISNREALFKETQFSLRQTFPKESTEKKA